MMRRGLLFYSTIPLRGAERADTGGSLLFPYWSFTKTVIAICALMLAERGRIDLDEAVVGRPFTLRQLLNHTAGLPDYGTLPAYHQAVASNEEPWSRDDLLRATLGQGMLFSPGCGWRYSNVGYMLARDRLEEAAGCAFPDLVESMIASRLGLKTLVLATTREQFSHVHWSGAQRYHPGWVYHGCLIGTAREAALLLQALFTGELVTEASLRQMLTPVPLGGAIEGRPWTDCGYGLGLMIGRMGPAGRAIGHSGGGPVGVNACYHFPDLPEPVTVATFADSPDEGRAEFEALRQSGAPRLR